MTVVGTNATALCPVARVFFSGDTRVAEYGWSTLELLRADVRALTVMSADPQREGASTHYPVDWELYRRLKSEGRLNLLFRFSESAAASLPTVGTPVSRPNVLPFISRAEHLARRERGKKGRWVKLSWTPEERNTILRQDELYRRSDERWQLNHGPVLGGAIVVHFSGELVMNRLRPPTSTL